VDVENPGRYTSDVVNQDSWVSDSAATRLGDPRWDPWGLPGLSTVVGRAHDALSIDTYGAGPTVFHVYVGSTRFHNASRFSRDQRVH
jgi:hypothetical protein